MGRVAEKARIKLNPEGRVGSRLPLCRLLGSLGLLSATCVLELSRSKLTRRFVLSEGRIEALVSNARDDRLVDWLLTRDGIRTDQSRRLAEIAERAAEAPLTAQLLVATRLFELDELGRLMREHLAAMLGECQRWKDGAYAIRPGSVNLGAEPPASWPALQAALELARQHVAKATRRVKVPPRVIAYASEATLAGVSLGDAERLVLAQCVDGRASKSAVANAVGVDPRAAGEALEVLFETGLLLPSEEPRPESVASIAAEEKDDAPLTVEVLERWLEAAAREDFSALLGLSPGVTDRAEVRRHYYRTVRRFHPDRFREGEFAPYFKQVEQAFRLVHEAEQMITDPHARARREREKQGASGPSPARVARVRLSRAKEAAAAGRRQEALEHLDRAVEAQPDDVDLRLRHAALLSANPSRRTEALAILKKLAAEQSTRPEIIASYALALQRAGKPDEAQAVLATARSLDPSQLLVRAAEGDETAREKLSADPLLAQLLQ